MSSIIVLYVAGECWGLVCAEAFKVLIIKSKACKIGENYDNTHTHAGF